jgi:hypothetical protein
MKGRDGPRNPAPVRPGDLALPSVGWLRWKGSLGAAKVLLPLDREGSLGTRETVASQSVKPFQFLVFLVFLRGNQWSQYEEIRTAET